MSEAQQAADAISAVNDNKQHDLNIPAFVPTEDPEENALHWTRWIRGFCRKLRFFRITNTQDKSDALHIYGGYDLEILLDTMPDIDKAQVDVPDYVKQEAEQVNDFHIQVASLTGISAQWKIKTVLELVFM